MKSKFTTVLLLTLFLFSVTAMANSIIAMAKVEALEQELEVLTEQMARVPNGIDGNAEAIIVLSGAVEGLAGAVEDNTDSILTNAITSRVLLTKMGELYFGMTRTFAHYHGEWVE